MCWIEGGKGSNKTWTCPLRRSVMACAAPLYGTWRKSTPVIDLNSAPARCCVVPLPGEPWVIFPRAALAQALNPGTVLAGKDAFAVMTFGNRLTPPTGV